METRYYFGQVPSTILSYKKKVPIRTTAGAQVNADAFLS